MNNQTTERRANKGPEEQKDSWECRKHPCYETSIENRNIYSQNSLKPPKMSNSGGRLRELGPYWFRILLHKNMVTAGTYPMFYVFHSCNKSVSRMKSDGSH